MTLGGCSATTVEIDAVPEPVWLGKSLTDKMDDKFGCITGGKFTPNAPACDQEYMRWQLRYTNLMCDILVAKGQECAN